LHPLSHDINSAKIKTWDKITWRVAAPGQVPGRKPGQLNKRTIEAVKTMGPVGERAIGVLVGAMEDARVQWSCRIQAASLICDRAFARAPQSVTLEEKRRLNDLTLDEMRQLEARLAGEQLTIDAVATPAADILSASDPTTSRP
jgi:hypothetical protein